MMSNPLRLILTFSLLLISITTITIIFAKKNVRGVESNVVYTIERIIDDNQNLYTDISNPPYAITQYNPMYYLLGDGLLSLFSISSTNNSYLIRIILRLFSLISFLLLLYFSYKLISQLGIDLCLYEKLIFYLLITCLTMPWYFISRPDVLVSLFNILSAYYLILSFNKKGVRLIIMAGIFSILAFLSKQNGILIFLIISSYLILRLKFKHLFYNFIGATIGLATFIIIYYVSGYSLNNLYDNLVIGISNGIDIDKAIQKAYNPFVIMYGFPLLLIFYLIYEKHERIINDLKLSFVTYFLVLSLFFAVFTSLKYGSAINYFNDTIIFSVILGFCLAYSYKKLVIQFIIVFCFTISVYQFLAYSPRSIFSIFDKEYREELNYTKQIVSDKLQDGFFYTNIKSLILEQHEKVIFPQYEIVLSGFKNNNPSKNVYNEILNNIDFSNIEILIIDTNLKSIKFDLNEYILVDKKNSIEIYQKH